MAVVAPLRNGIKLLFVGMLMGLCDLVPGVSGSSMAYLCGIYENIIEAVNAPKRYFAFLTPLFLGICLSLVAFALPLNLAMQNTIARPLLLSFFIGLSLACAVRAFSQAKGNLVFLLLGVLCSLLLNMLAFTEVSLPSYSVLFFAGITAGMAMLFPAISGAQILYLLGLYPFIIQNLAHCIATRDSASLIVLISLGLGALCGLYIASKLMRLLFDRFSHSIHGFFAGFIFMALPRLWPFQTILPTKAWFWSAAGLLILGLAMGLGLNQLADRGAKQ